MKFSIQFNVDNECKGKPQKSKEHVNCNLDAHLALDFTLNVTDNFFDQTWISRNHEFLALIRFPLLIFCLFPSYFYVLIELVRC